MKIRLHTLLLAAATVAISALPARTLIDFDTPGDYGNNFSGSFLELPTGGVAGSGGVETSSLNQVAVFQQGIDLRTFKDGYVSVMFQYNGADMTGAPLSIGFTSGPGDFFDTFGKTSGSADFRFLLLGNADVRDGYAVNIRDDGVGFGRSGFAQLTPDAWYMAKLTIGSVEDGWIMNARAELFEVDAHGAVGERIALFDTITDVGPINRENALALADVVYPFFGGQEPWSRGVGAFDNFEFSATATAPAPAPTVIDFDAPGDYDNNFSGTFLELPGGGVAGSGGVETSSLDQIAVFQQGIDLKTFDNGYVSVMFQYNGADMTGAPVAIGFTSGPSDFFNTFGQSSGTADFRFLLLGSGGVQDGYAVNIRDDGVGFGRSDFIPLTPNAWYKAKLTIGSVQDGWIMNASAELFEVDADGNVGRRIALYDTTQQVRPVDDPRYIDSVGGPINRENALALADLVFPFFGGQEPFSRGVGAFDNFAFSATGDAPAATWFGWEIEADGWVDTGDWIGWVYVAADLWVWIHNLQSWAYMPDDSGWAYIVR